MKTPKHIKDVFDATKDDWGNINDSSNTSLSNQKADLDGERRNIIPSQSFAELYNVFEQSNTSRLNKNTKQTLPQKPSKKTKSTHKRFTNFSRS